MYGPWGRPDMAMFLFTDAIINKRSIKVFNSGDLSRDFTYINDIIAGVDATLLEDSKDTSLCKLYNIGNSAPVQLMDFIKSIGFTVLFFRFLRKPLPDFVISL